ncbi:MAG: formate dehydrogenase accessory sulfurtransferase FdhD [Firmicutes bacterium]|nr:formate dehydrogenase accessory sulfurtransferase FdhD [Bacillota bacterium]
MSGLTARKNIIVIREGKKVAAGDDVVVEAPLTIFLNGEELVTLLCTPEKRESLAIGFLYSAGLLTSLDDLVSLCLQDDGKAVRVELKNGGAPGGKLNGTLMGSPGCTREMILPGALAEPDDCPAGEDALLLTAGEIHFLMSELQERAALFKTTGGVHSAALSGGGKLLLFCEDISRHNAIDKIVGECLQRQISMDDKALLCSCRPSFGILLKAARLRLPLLVSRAAPSTLSIEMADSLNITLVGFVRGRRMNIYTHPRRITG